MQREEKQLTVEEKYAESPMALERLARAQAIAAKLPPVKPPTPEQIKSFIEEDWRMHVAEENAVSEARLIRELKLENLMEKRTNTWLSFFLKLFGKD